MLYNNSAALRFTIKNRQFPALITLFWIMFSSVVLIYITQWGIGTSPDSAIYLGAADNLLNGKGLTIPFGDPPNRELNFYPPLYPVMLSLSGALVPGVSLLQSARWLNVILLCGFITILAALIIKASPTPQWFTALFLFPFASGSVILNLFMMAWSEPLFLLVTFAGFAVTISGLSRTNSSLIATGSLLLGMSALTRYAGVSVIAAVMITILIFKKGNFLERLRYCLLGGLPALILSAIWPIRSFLLNGQIGNRAIEFHLPAFSKGLQALNTISGWFFIPSNSSSVLKFGIIASILSICLLLIFKNFHKLNETGKWTFYLISGFSVVYPLFLLFSLTFMDANTPLDDRILSPLFVSINLLIIFALVLLFPENGSKRNIFISATLAILIIYLFISFSLQGDLYKIYHLQGVGFSQTNWRNSSTIAAVSQIPTSLNVVTNSPEAIYLLTGRSSTSLPRKVDLTRQTVNPDFDEKFDKLIADVLAGNSMIIYFHSIRSNSFPDLKEIEKTISSNIPYQTFEDGTLIGGSK
ncbi:MAG: hypothetical protein AB1522_07895 [Chloroflexota bacterium]